VIESLGEDAEAVDARIASDREREKRLGLSFVVGSAAKSMVFDTQGQSTGDTVAPNTYAN
ncbi:MAG: hypothetical protein WCK65_16170, partial [Rhodospirillaceae bacterium]